MKPNATLSLVVRLYSIPDDLEHVVFDLFWGYPIRNENGPLPSRNETKKDYLDATCFMFNDTLYLGKVDYKNRNTPGINHSGDVMDDTNRKGHHTINLDLEEIPTDITHLFFTLSAWSSPTISKFPNPSLKFYDASDQENDLCSTSFTHANSSQAVIMCNLSKKNGRWQIFEMGKLSAGNAKDYDPLVDTINNLISSGF